MNLFIRHSRRFQYIALTGLALFTLRGSALGEASQSLDEANFQGWTGVEATTDGGVLRVPGTAVYRVPDGTHRPSGLQTERDAVIDGLAWYGLRFDVALDRDDAPFVGELTLIRPSAPGRRDMIDSTKATLRLQGKGWHSVTLPFTAFDYARGQRLVLQRISQLAFSGRYDGSGDTAGRVVLRHLRLVRGNVVALASEIRSRPADADGTVTYSVSVTNCAESPGIFNLNLERTGWEGMPATVTPATLTLGVGQSASVTVSVTVPGWLPGGARETQILVVTPQGAGDAAEKINFITSRRLPFPYLVHTAAGWDEVRTKIKTHAWAAEALADFVRRADAFNVPDVNGPRAKGVFPAYIERGIWPSAVAWKLTGERRHAEKFALFLRRLVNPTDGYPTKRMANSADIPQEGGLWETAAWGYDMIQDARVLTAEDTRLIEISFRRYIDSVIAGNGNGGISNWSVFNLCPAGLCALALHDFVRFDELMSGPSGIIDELRYGVMDDGWWYEMSLSYNLACAEAFTSLGLAARPFGLNLLDAKFPVATTRIVGLRPFEFEAFEGMAFGKYGPVRDNTVTVKKMWDGIALYPDYRGIMFGMGDGHEESVSGERFDRAFFAFRDPAYAAVIKRGKQRDLLYGVADLPADTPKLYSFSGHSDNAGIAVLRSQTLDRPASGQINAVLKYGTHGSYHGHFDRMALNALMRYGRSFYNPETSWYGYPSYMYKWWVQTSLSHNMVVVDAKMQEPSECVPLIYYSGPQMQVFAAETTTRWSNPPYFGGYDQLDAVRQGNSPYVPIPEIHPKPAEVTGFTEPVRQRRLMIVTDDYVVLADDLRGEKEHTFDNLLHLRGASIERPDRFRFLRHDAQLNTDPLGSGQFITNVARYAAVDAPAIFRSVHRVAAEGDRNRPWETGGQKSLSEPGVLHVDAHILWPRQPELALGDYAENWNVGKKLVYKVVGDERTLAEGVFGAWILGQEDIDADLTGVKVLRLSTNARRGRDTRRTLFWADAVLIAAGGRKIPVATLQPTTRNVAPVPKPGLDYQGGPVRIAGVPAATAIPAEANDDTEDAVLTYDLTGLGAVRLKARVGGDWPVGDEEQLRKVCAVRTTGRAAQFLTLIEPYEEKSLVKSAIASDPGHLRVELTDGRGQEIEIRSLDATDGKVAVQITETKDGRVLRSESATSQ